MTPAFIAVHRSQLGSLAVGRPWLSADELTACGSAAALLARLQALVLAREADLAQAREAARQAGQAEGLAEALHRAGPALAQSWRQAADDAALQAEELREAAIALALQIVERIAAELAPADVVAALVRRAAESLAPGQPAVLRLHPEVAAALQHLPEVAAGGPLQLRADPALALLDCVFDTPAGQLIAGLPAQLRRVGDRLQAAAAAEQVR
ncbi:MULTISPECIES: FliH/SctL family protein [Aquincola]|uniref:FliH/SctL family protein n=1 Tax=Aquincola TaxID=391952 RepID=UPI0006152A3D|nr:MULTISPECIES: FliH/SctL family protein [Aquincola]MCR5867122.1 flagellar assembly protein FliH [Aquincola sp. J276]